MKYHLPNHQIDSSWTHFSNDYIKTMNECLHKHMKQELWDSTDNQIEEDYWFRLHDILQLECQREVIP